MNEDIYLEDALFPWLADDSMSDAQELIYDDDCDGMPQFVCDKCGATNYDEDGPCWDCGDNPADD